MTKYHIVIAHVMRAIFCMIGVVSFVMFGFYVFGLILDAPWRYPVYAIFVIAGFAAVSYLGFRIFSNVLRVLRKKIDVNGA